MKNTYKEGLVTLLVYPEGNHFTGVCLQFNLIVEAETAELAREKLVDAVQAHAGVVIKNKYSEELLNRPAPKKYWDKYKGLLQKEQKGLENKTLLPSHPLTFVQNVSLSDVMQDPAYV